MNNTNLKTFGFRCPFALKSLLNINTFIFETDGHLATNIHSLDIDMRMLISCQNVTHCQFVIFDRCVFVDRSGANEMIDCSFLGWGVILFIASSVSVSEDFGFLWLPGKVLPRGAKLSNFVICLLLGSAQCWTLFQRCILSFFFTHFSSRLRLPYNNLIRFAFKEKGYRCIQNGWVYA